MSNESGLSVTKPTSILKKSIDLNWRDFLKALGKAGVNAAFGKWDSLAGDAMDVLGALGLKAGTGEITWLLVYRSLLRAMEKLVKETELATKPINLNALQAQINQVLGNSSLAIDDKFFRHPGQAAIIGLIQPVFRDWLKNSGLMEADAGVVSLRLPSYFSFALHEEWGSRRKDYVVIQENLDTPFTKAQERERSWLRYGAWLQKQVQEPMFAEAFSLQQVFVPLRAYYSQKKNADPDEQITGSQNSERVVVELETELETWLNAADKNDAIRLVSGGPGSGKSSLTKMWAARLAEEDKIRVLFIPLHHFEPTADLVEAVGKFVETGDFLAVNPLLPEHREERLLIIFDGLDELAMQGKIGERTAQDFVGEVQRTVGLMNHQKAWVQVLISGRELVVQASETNFRKEWQILYLLPYFLSDFDKDLLPHFFSKDERKKYIDPQNLLGEDQRQLWWQRYGKVSGKDYPGLPAELDKKNLAEITSQPLLNYLVALSLRRGELDFSEETNLNAVYADLLKAIYERGWANCQHPTLQGIEEKDFQRILEEIALAAWHGNGRTTTVQEIENHCNSSGLKNLLTNFQKGLEENSSAGVTRLLTAFYFRQSGQDYSGDKTFEFTHKSFGEYLTAKRILREVGLIHRKLEARKSDPDEGWDEEDALYRWALLCGSSTMDQYLWNFIFDEVRLVHLHDAAVVATWQQTFCGLIEFMMRYGMPMKRLNLRRFQEENRQAINAEDSLLAVLGTFQRITQKLSKIDFPTPSAFGALLGRLQGQRVGIPNPMSFLCLSYLDLSGCILHGRDFSYANFGNTNLQGAYLQRVDFKGANLRDANLQGAKLQEANLRKANLQGANLQGANTQEAYLGHVNLEQVNFRGVNLSRVNLEHSNLQYANLGQANLEFANLRGVNLRGVNFEYANLQSTNFQGANLQGANFQGADFRGANLRNTILEGKL